MISNLQTNLEEAFHKAQERGKFKKAKEIAINLLEDKNDVEFIVEVTGLDSIIVENLRESIDEEVEA